MIFPVTVMVSFWIGWLHHLTPPSSGLLYHSSRLPLYVVLIFTSETSARLESCVSVPVVDGPPHQRLASAVPARHMQAASRRARVNNRFIECVLRGVRVNDTRKPLQELEHITSLNCWGPPC